MLLQIQDGTLTAGGHPVLSHFHFEIKGNEKIALVGRNGSGKTTLLRLLASELSLERDDKSSGSGLYTSRALSIGLLHQSPFSDLSVTVEEEILKSCPCKDLFDQERFAWEQEYDRIFTAFGLKKEDKQKPLSHFSGGEQTKIALICLLLKKPDILLLDEPTNHLDLSGMKWLESYLKAYPYAVVIVSHDRFFLDEVVDTVYDLSNGRLTRYSGNYTAFRMQKQKNLQLQQKAYQQQLEERQRLQDLIERFKHKPKKAAFARSRKKILERMQKLEKPVEDDIHLFTAEIPPLVRSSKWVLEAKDLQIGYVDDSPLAELSLRIRRGQKIGIIGANGTGKSTFLKTAAGLIAPQKGKLTLGLSVQTGYFDQQVASLSSDKTIIEHFHELFPALTEKEVRTILGSYLFPGKDAGKKIKNLSGGEKARLVLAELLQSRPNLLLLDEPTNHMDIPARETLESAFTSYQGTLLFVSHDRYFIKKVAESLLIFDDHTVLYYPFGYTHYLEHCQKNNDTMHPSARIKAEEQALISGLRNVPKAERHSLKDIPTERAYEEWQLSLAMRPLEQLQKELERFMAGRDLLREWEDETYCQAIAAQEAALQQHYTDACLLWYDKWLEFSIH